MVHARIGITAAAIGGGLVDAAALMVLVSDDGGRWGRFALGLMVPTSIAVAVMILVGVVLSRVQSTRAHFDGLIDANAARLARLEERMDEGDANTYLHGLDHRRAIDGRGRVRAT